MALVLYRTRVLATTRVRRKLPSARRYTRKCAGRERHFYALPVIRPNRTRRHMVNLCAHKRGLSENAALTGNPCELTNEAYTMLGRIPFRKPKEEILEIGRASCRERV